MKLAHSFSKFGWLAGICAGLFAVAPALGQGIIYPRDGIREQPFSIKSVKVQSTVKEALAETTVEQMFVNNSSVEQTGTYLFPLPDGATVTSFSLTAGDKVLEGKVLPKDEARGIYESIVRKRKDPALLEYLGSRLFRASVFPIPPQGERLLTLRYAEVIKPEGAVRKFVYPLTLGKLSARPVGTTSVSVKIATNTPLRTVYSPTHDVSIRRPEDKAAIASWESGPGFPDRDFTVYYGTTGDDVGLSMLTAGGMDKAGYFLLVASPRFSVPKDKVLPKQIVFVLDKTGSMKENKKIDQAKTALLHCLSNLNANDRFNVVTFNEGADPMNKGLVAASRANVDKAKAAVDDIEASGGTNIDEALREALKELKADDGGQKMIVFLTDGLPTVGETNPEKILENVRKVNLSREDAGKEVAGVGARIFNLGVGYDVNVPMLEKLADQNRGDCDFVRPEETVESIAAAFYAKVSSPVLSNVAIAFDGVETFDVMPKRVPDLFKGTQLVITGRYKGEAPGEVRLTGTAMGDKQTFRLAKAFGDNAARSSLVPRIWATRKIGFLLDQVRVEQSKEVIDEIVRLSKEYGILTPYTSYLADERQDRAVTTRVEDGTVRYFADTKLGDQIRDSAVNELHALRERKDVSGAFETYRALNSQSYQSASRAPAQNQAGGGRYMDMAGRGAAPGFGGGGFGGGLSGGASGPMKAADAAKSLGKLQRSQFGLDYNSVNLSEQLDGFNRQNMQNAPAYQQLNNQMRVQAAGDRVFYRRGKVWFDEKYADGAKVLKIKALSKAHLDLIDRIPSLKKYAAVGDEVVLMIGKTAVQIGAEGKETLTATELAGLTNK